MASADGRAGPASPAQRVPRTTRGALLGLGVLCSLVGAWLSVPRAGGVARPDRPALRVVLLDASASVTARRTRWRGFALRALRDEAGAARAAGEELLVLRVAADVERLFGPADPRELERRLAGAGAPAPDPALPLERSLDSDLPGAVDLAARALLEPGRAAGRLVLLSDLELPAGTRVAAGRGTERRLAYLLQRGVRLERRELPEPDAPAVALRSLQAPARLAPDAPWAARVQLSAGTLSGAGPETLAQGSLEIVLRGPKELRLPTRPLAPPPGCVPDGRGTWNWTRSVELPPLPPGTWVLEARVRLPGDRSPEDDRACCSVRVEGAPEVVVWCAPERADAVARELEPLARALPGLVLRLVPPGERLTSLVGADALWTVGLPARDLPAADLLAFVRSGRGWLFGGEAEVLAGWGSRPRDGEAADLLPLGPAPDPEGPRDVLLLVDGSGSMSGEPFERVRRAAAALVEGLSGDDRLQLRTFTDDLHPPLLEAAGDDPVALRAALADLLAARNPSGSTDLDRTLLRLVEERAGNPRRALLLLLGDGHDTDGTGLGADLRPRLLEVGVRPVVLAVEGGGRPAARGELARLLGPGEDLVEARDLESLPDLLLEAVRGERTRVHTGTRWAAVVAPAAGRATDLLRALAVAPAPSPTTSLDLVLRDDARALLVGDDDAPLLAQREVGEGSVVAAADPLLLSGPWRGRHDLLGPLLRALCAGSPGNTGGVRARVEDGLLWLEDAEQLPLELSGQLVRAGPRDPGDPVPLPGVAEQVLAELALAPDPGSSGADPRSLRRAPWPADLAGGRSPTEPLMLRLVGADGAVLDRLRLEPPRPSELEPGVPLPWPEDPAPEEAPSPDLGAHPAAPWCLGAGCLVLGLVGVMGRRPRRSGVAWGAEGPGSRA